MRMERRTVGEHGSACPRPDDNDDAVNHAVNDSDSESGSGSVSVRALVLVLVLVLNLWIVYCNACQSDLVCLTSLSWMFHPVVYSLIRFKLSALISADAKKHFECHDSINYSSRCGSRVP